MIKEDGTWAWVHTDSHEISVILNDAADICGNGIVRYTIERYSRYTSDNSYGDPWSIWRGPQNDDDECVELGYLGRWNNDVGIVCGCGMMSAMGLPDMATFSSYDECKKVCEKDFENLKNGTDNVFIENEQFVKENLRVI
jgi:hypothetical protein